eukprot:7540219-Pyramimonas_sp.AAC.1
MSKARALRVTIGLARPPEHFRRQGHVRDVFGDLNLQVMRMHFCHFGLKYDRINTLPSGSYLQVAATCTRIPTNLWRSSCNAAGEPT